MAIYGNALMTGAGQGGGGGEILPTDAILRVIAPAGSTVTISKGSTTKTDMGHANADDPTLYDYYFIIHQSQFDAVNPWTVTATDGVDTASDTVIIDAADEYDVELSYNLYIVKNGVVNTAVTSGVQAVRYAGTSSGNTGSVTFEDGFVRCAIKYSSGNGASWRIGCAEDFDLSKYSTMVLKVASASQSKGAWGAASNSITSTGTTSWYASTNQTIMTDDQLIVDLTGVNLGYLYFSLFAGTGVNQTIDVTDWYLAH